jgi:suppressor of ftsI
LLRADPAAAQGENVLTQPPEIRSRNGVLSTTIVAAPGRVQMGDVAFPGLLYNGSYVPPLLRARLGDVMRITFDNGLPVNPRICTATA